MNIEPILELINSKPAALRKMKHAGFFLSILPNVYKKLISLINNCNYACIWLRLIRFALTEATRSSLGKIKMECFYYYDHMVISDLKVSQA